MGGGGGGFIHIHNLRNPAFSMTFFMLFAGVFKIPVHKTISPKQFT